MLERKFMRMPCFLGNFRARDLMACTTTTLNSSEISLTNVAICFIKRSTEDSAPENDKGLTSTLNIDSQLRVFEASATLILSNSSKGLLISFFDVKRFDFCHWKGHKTLVLKLAVIPTPTHIPDCYHVVELEHIASIWCSWNSLFNTFSFSSIFPGIFSFGKDNCFTISTINAMVFCH